jgi:phosphopantetheinyl transferase (holo-ACP synthase)
MKQFWYFAEIKSKHDSVLVKIIMPLLMIVCSFLLQIQYYIPLFMNRYWCLKEAFVKATGAGVGFGLHRLEFHHEHWTNISIHIDGGVSRKWRFWLFELDEMHLVCITAIYFTYTGT